MKSEEKCNVNATRFKNPTRPETAYVLGMLWADGYIRNTGTGRAVILEIVEEDAIQLKEVFYKTGNWHYDVRCRLNKKPISRLMATNKYLYDFLYSLGYEAKSELSANKVLSLISNKLKPYWWRGYFDGDGCLYANGNIIQASFSSSYNQEWDFVEKLLFDLNVSFSIKKRSHNSKTKTSHSSYVRFTGRQNVKKFFNYIYSPNLESFGLSRKFEKFKNLPV